MLFILLNNGFFKSRVNIDFDVDSYSAFRTRLVETFILYNTLEFRLAYFY